MKTVYLRAEFEPIFIDGAGVYISNDVEQHEFYIGEVKFIIKSGEKVFTSTAKIHIEEQELEYLTNKNLPTNKELDKKLNILRESFKIILEYLTYLYSIPEINEDLNFNGKTLWSFDNKNWNNIIYRNIKPCWKPHRVQYFLPDNFFPWLTSLSKDGIEITPFVAFSYLHRAFIEKNTKYKWINATIAAELAFKEFLSRYDKKTFNLILNIPSPPIKKLYRDVLKDFTNEESPMYSFLEKGAERRNKLIHNPETAFPTINEANKYVCQVEVAIMHLLTLLYKNNEFIKYIYQRSSEKLEREKNKTGDIDDIIMSVHDKTSLPNPD